jgi:putative hydrolase of the HAD superfamily
MGYRAVIFDRDNTLLHLQPAMIRDFEQRVIAIAPTIPPGGAVAHWMGWPGPWPRTAAEEDQFWLHFWSTLGLRHTLTAAQIEQLQQVGAFYHASFVAFPDALPCLAALRADNYKLAVLTNFDLPSVDRTLRHCGIDPAWFDALCSSAELGVRKPSPESYRHVLGRLGVEPHECLFVDDLIEHIEGASVVGIRGILLDRQDQHPSYAGERITTLLQLPNTIRQSNDGIS